MSSTVKNGTWLLRAHWVLAKRLAVRSLDTEIAWESLSHVRQPLDKIVERAPGAIFNLIVDLRPHHAIIFDDTVSI
jgi:hypothetical protein